MVRWSAVALIVLAVVHLLVLGIDVPAELPKWLEFSLWTLDHWQPLRAQPLDLALSSGVFWATAGSFAVPLLILGSLLLWLDRRGDPIPAFVGWTLAGWTALMTLLMPPSGFPLGLLIALCLAVGLERRKTQAKISQM